MSCETSGSGTPKNKDPNPKNKRKPQPYIDICVSSVALPQRKKQSTTLNIWHCPCFLVHQNQENSVHLPCATKISHWLSELMPCVPSCVTLGFSYEKWRLHKFTECQYYKDYSCSSPVTGPDSSLSHVHEPFKQQDHRQFASTKSHQQSPDLFIPPLNS